MAIKISKLDLISRFTSRVQDYATSQTNWVYGTGVWNTNVGTVTGNSGAYGGGYNRTASSDTVASPSAVSSDLPNTLKASNAGSTIVSVLKNFLLSYSNNHRVTLQNTGNLAPGSYSGIVKLNDMIAGAKTLIASDVDSAALARNLVNQKVIKEINVDGFIDDCKNIWINRCINVTQEIFYYSYCHSSCHSNHGSHGSRERR